MVRWWRGGSSPLPGGLEGVEGVEEGEGLGVEALLSRPEPLSKAEEATKGLVLVTVMITVAVLRLYGNIVVIFIACAFEINFELV